jgi:hypothetical protein
MQATKASSAEAAATVDSLDQQLESNAGARAGHEADLQAALDRVAGLKKSIKAAAKEHDRLRSARKAARRTAATARHRAEQAEARYDSAVLADLLRREKAQDLSAHRDTPAGGAARDSNADGEAVPEDPSPAPEHGPSDGSDTDEKEPGTTPARSRSTRSSAARTTTARAGTAGGGTSTRAGRRPARTRPRTPAADQPDSD